MALTLALVLACVGVGAAVALDVQYDVVGDGIFSDEGDPGISDVRNEDAGPIPSGVEDDFVHVIAPSEQCWQFSLNRRGLGDTPSRIEHGCGGKSVVLDATGGLRAYLGLQPQSWSDIGMRIEVDGEIVRDILPAPYGGLAVEYADDLRENTIDVRLMAPPDGCWMATIEDDVFHECGSTLLPLQVRGNVNGVFERTPPAGWTWCLVVEWDGNVVQTVGPDSNPVYPLGFGWGPPDDSGIPYDPQIDPVSC
jgi:hypothetical protein